MDKDIVIDMVQDKKTGVWYNPQEKWNELKQQPWFIDQLKRVKDEAWEEGITDMLRDLKGE